MPTLQRSHTENTLPRRQISLVSLSARYLTVRRPIPSSGRAHLIRCTTLGVVVVLFFLCMSSLLNPANRGMGGIKWPLVIHTLVMFSFVTVFTTQSLLLESDSYVDNRDFPGNSLFLPGPFAYQVTLYTAAISLIPTIMIYVNTWLADGLLVSPMFNSTYSMSHFSGFFSSIVATSSMPRTTGSSPYHSSHISPRLVCLRALCEPTPALPVNTTGIAMGTGYIYQIVRLGGNPSTFTILFDFGTPFYSISLSLCVLLTFMIVGRLILHSRNIRNAMGSLAGAGGFYKAVSAMLIESYALYVANFILFIGSWGASSSLQHTFFPILAEVQVRTILFPPRRVVTLGNEVF